MPDLHLVFASRHIAQAKLPLPVSDRVVGMVHDNDPTLHPAMGITLYPNDLRLVEFLLQFFLELRLRLIKGRVRLAIGMNVVQNTVVIENLEFRSSWRKNNMRRVDTFFLI